MFQHHPVYHAPTWERQEMRRRIARRVFSEKHLAILTRHAVPGPF